MDNEVLKQHPIVLVAEDDTATRHMIRAALHEEGYPTLEGIDGLRVYDQLCASEDPLIVVLDYHLPHLDGMQMLKALSVHPYLRTRHLFIMMTGDQQALPRLFTTLVEGMSVDLISKPFEIEDLITTVNEAAKQLIAREQGVPGAQSSRADTPR